MSSSLFPVWFQCIRTSKDIGMLKTVYSDYISC
uniref:Uncharacterized protein n=1 Tax=Ackermannviridae sp. ctUml7 TaxID=2825753 RepID=A0A8S5VA42_9CAUD|nr:MAG TPA: hypothetical protein [Ackermannviridae sp. ctUml7]